MHRNVYTYAQFHNSRFFIGIKAIIRRTEVPATKFSPSPMALYVLEPIHEYLRHTDMMSLTGRVAAATDKDRPVHRDVILRASTRSVHQRIYIFCSREVNDFWTKTNIIFSHRGHCVLCTRRQRHVYIMCVCILARLSTRNVMRTPGLGM